MWPIDSFNKLGLRIQKWFDEVGRVNVFGFDGEHIIRHKGWFAHESFPVRDIKAWTRTCEMGFDIVDIELRSGRQLRWMDSYNDLLTILHRSLAEKEL